MRNFCKVKFFFNILVKFDLKKKQDNLFGIILPV